MLHVIDSDKPIDRVGEDLEKAAAANQFGVLGVHDLKATMAKKGVEFETECRVYEICNPHQAKRALATGMGISTALPCRISIWRDEGATRIATMKPTEMMAVFDIPELKDVAHEVEESIFRIMDEAAR